MSIDFEERTRWTCVMRLWYKNNVDETSIKYSFRCMCVSGKPIDIPYNESETYLHSLKAKNAIMLTRVFAILSCFLIKSAIFEKRLWFFNIPVSVLITSKNIVAINRISVICSWVMSVKKTIRGIIIIMLILRRSAWTRFLIFIFIETEAVSLRWFCCRWYF